MKPKSAYMQKKHQTRPIKSTNSVIPLWYKIRDRIIKRDDGACRICKRDYDLHVHHIDYQRSNNDDSNLVTLCNTCHTAVHRERYKPSEHPDHPAPWGMLQN